MNTTKIIVCVCRHPQQDSIHGSQKRVANWARKTNNNEGGWRCTVCGKVHPK